MIGRFINSRAKEKLKVAPSVDQSQRPRTAGDPDPPDHDRTRSGSASTAGVGLATASYLPAGMKHSRGYVRFHVHPPRGRSPTWETTSIRGCAGPAEV